MDGVGLIMSVWWLGWGVGRDIEFMTLFSIFGSINIFLHNKTLERRNELF